MDLKYEYKHQEGPQEECCTECSKCALQMCMLVQMAISVPDHFKKVPNKYKKADGNNQVKNGVARVLKLLNLGILLDALLLL